MYGRLDVLVPGKLQHVVVENGVIASDGSAAVSHTQKNPVVHGAELVVVLVFGRRHSAPVQQGLDHVSVLHTNLQLRGTLVRPRGCSCIA